jgi:hypothetical protein
VRGRADQRTERRREAHIYGLRAESIAALLLDKQMLMALLKAARYELRFPSLSLL